MDSRKAVIEFLEGFNPAKNNLSDMREKYILNINEKERGKFYNDITQVVRNYLLLDYMMRIPLKKKQNVTRNNRAVIFAALNEIFFSSKPEYVVNEYVSYAKQKREKGFINWILRSILRETNGKLENVKPPNNKIREISIKYSFPVDFTVKLSEEFNKKKTIKIFTALMQEVPSVFMVNKFSKSRSELNCKEILPDVHSVCDNKIAQKENKEGKILLFEKASLFPVYLLNARENEKILDLTAAPGNKSFMIYNLVNGKIDLTLNELNKERLKVMEHNIKKWNMDVQLTNYNGKNFPKEEKFDAVFIDAPCTNTGVIAKRPDVKYKLKMSNIERLNKLQIELVLSGLELLKENGRLVFSVCSFLSEEIKEIVNEVEKRTEFKAIVDDIPNLLTPFIEDNYIRIIPTKKNPIGFEMALFQKK